MTMQALPTRQQIDRAQPLEFKDAPVEKPVTISIEVAPDGLHVRCDYVGTLSSIPAAIERLRAAGIVELVSAAAPAAPMIAPANIQPPRKAKKERISPIYQPDGTAVCPVHLRPLQESQHGGFYCSAKARPGDAQNERGYCNLKFED